MEGREDRGQWSEEGAVQKKKDNDGGTNRTERNKRKTRTECRICKRGTRLPDSTPLWLFTGRIPSFVRPMMHGAWSKQGLWFLWSLSRSEEVISVVRATLSCRALSLIDWCDGRGLPAPFFVFVFVRLPSPRDPFLTHSRLTWSTKETD